MLSQGASDKDISLKNPQEQPTDTVSFISWSPNPLNPMFATSSWDSQVRIYNLNPNSSTLAQKACFDAESPCLSVKWSLDEKKLFTGCIDGSIKVLDAETRDSNVIGFHEEPVKSVYCLEKQNALLTISYDKTIRFWDPRQAEHVAGFKLDYRPFCSDLIYPYLAIGLSEAKVLLLNLDEIQTVLGAGTPKYLDSPLKVGTQLTSIRFFPGLKGIGISGNDGRCNVSRIERLSDGGFYLDNIMTFKAQKLEEGDRRELYQVNTIGFHPNRRGDFCYTAGSEGKMYYWDIQRKSKTAEFDFKGAPVSQAEIDPSGKFMAYALGYDWARGIGRYMSSGCRVCVHVLQNKELEYACPGVLERDYPFKY